MCETVIITGASGRLGRFVVRRFADEETAIAAVVLNEEEAESLELPDDGLSATFMADVTDEVQVARVFGKIGQRYDHVGGLVHTVGGWGARPLVETSLEEFDGLVRLNLYSTFLCFREGARLMRDSGGSLIGIASRQGADLAVAEQIAYSVSKAGVVRLVEAVADEYNGTELTAHAIAPSLILFDDAGDEGVHAADIADVCAYLCTDARKALNGAVIRAYGTLR